MAHVDTASDVTGKDVRPLVHESYDGSDIELSKGYTLRTDEYPELLSFKGETIITSDGTTLLGADDKAGIAEIMTALAYLTEHPEINHGPLELIFTPDEETGKGMDLFPYSELASGVCYTLDGGEDGSVEAVCFNGFKADVTFTGRVIHTGTARGKLANAVSMAGQFIGMLPRSESPEAMDGEYGFYAPMAVKGDLGEAWIEIFLRDYKMEEIERRSDALRSFAAAVEAAFPGGKVDVKISKQYLNMAESYKERPEIIGHLKDAIKGAGMEPVMYKIRGGTDGARLSEQGVPSPNVFAGGRNMHSRYEWIPLISMVRAVHTVLNLIEVWTEKS